MTSRHSVRGLHADPDPPRLRTACVGTLLAAHRKPRHIEQGYLKVLGKGNKERLVPIGATCQAALNSWREIYRGFFEVEESRTCSSTRTARC